MLEKEQLQMLGRTARWTAAVRSVESSREDRLFKDPWATALAGREGMDWVADRTIDSLAPIILRTRYFDDRLSCLAAQKRIRQIVLLAAGLDTRAFRLNWASGTLVFEVDQAAVLEAKEQTLASIPANPTCERRIVKADLTGPWTQALMEAGYDPRQPSAWLLEGFLFYLPTAAGVRILDEVGNMAAPGSWLGFDVMNSVMLTSPLSKKWVEMQVASGAPWIGTMDDPETFMATRGWEVTITQAGENDANYGRWPYPVIPVKMPNIPHNWLVTAIKK